MNRSAPRSPVDEARALVDRAWELRYKAMRTPTATAAEREEAAALVHRDLSEAVTLCRAAGAAPELSSALGKLGHVEDDAGRVDAALACYEEAVAVARGTDHPMLVAHAVRQLGDAHRRARRLAAAEACYTEALDLYGKQGAPPPLDYANAVRPMAILVQMRGDIDEARTLWLRARALYGVAGLDIGVDECTNQLDRLN